ICSSVKRLRFIPWSSQWARAYFKMDYFNGARSVRPNKKQITREIYETKVDRWIKLWPELAIVGWDQ
ncbi:hypothetical protein ACQZ5N_26190, partial [Agrobacterium sp. 22-221-1]